MDLLDEHHSQDALDFPVVYASGRAGIASLEQPENGAHARRPRPRAAVPDDPRDDPGADVRRGRAAAGPRHQPRRLAVPRPARAAPHPPGQPEEGPDRRLDASATARSRTSAITELLVTEGLERKPGESAGPGDIVAVAGIPDITIGETLADPENPVALPLIHVDEPAISMTIGTNTSPLVGRVKGAKVTARLVKDRLDTELGRQRVAAGPPDRAPRRLGGAGPRRAGAGHPGRADAPRGLRADRRQAAGGHQGDRRQGPRAGRAPDHRRARRSTSARSPSCSPPARAAWSR